MFKKTKVKEILAFLNKNLSEREIAETLAVSRNTVAHIRQEYEKSDLTAEDVTAMSADEIYRIFYPYKFRARNRFAPVDYAYVRSEMKKVGVTESLLYEEYCEKCDREGLNHCCFSTFASGYKRYIAERSYSSRVEHKPGFTLEVDWSGPTMSYYDKDKQDSVSAYLFVATLPYSQYTYVEATDSMDETNWISCNVHMLEFFGGSPVRIVCDNLKTGVVKHPKYGEIILNEAYLSFAEHYNVAILPAAVKKPKQKASVEGSVGKIARKIIGMLRNESFNSLEGVNSRIKIALYKLNNASFQKREGSRKTVFETEEKTFLNPLPFIPYEICKWSYNHKVGKDSHICFNKCFYSVPTAYIGAGCDVKYNASRVYIYSSHEKIAEHDIFPQGIKNRKRTDPSHLPYPLYRPDTVESIEKRATAVGFNTHMVIQRLFDNAKVKDQAVADAKVILNLCLFYDDEDLENACKKALKDYYLVNYQILKTYLKDVPRKKRISKTEEKSKDINKKSTGIVRGADYYSRKDENHE